MKIFLLVCVLAIGGLATTAPARTWTSADGKTLEAEFVSAVDGKVTIRRADGRTFTLSLTRLSDADREFVAGKGKEMQEVKVLPAADLDLGDYQGRLAGKWVKAEHRKIPYQVFGPSEVEAGTLLPIVVFLHGSGGRGDDNEQQMGMGPKSFVQDANFRERPCIVVAPQCPEGGYWTGDAGEVVVDLVEDILKEVSVADKKRVYLTGYSMGSFGTWSILGKEPRLFAAAVPIAGGGNPGLARDLRKIPIWTFHGDADTTCSVEDTRAIVAALEKARAPVTYTEMKGEGHGISWKVYRDRKVHEWLFAQKRD